MARGEHKALRMPPQTLESEKALLGALLIRPEGMLEATDVISPDAFYSEKHRIIYRGMLALFGKTNLSTLKAYVQNLPTKGHLRGWWCGIFGRPRKRSTRSKQCAPLRRASAKKYMLRNLIDAGEFVAELGYDEGSDIDETLDKAEKRVYEVTSSPTLSKFTRYARH